MKVNGREYPMWGQIAEREKEFIGGVLQDFGDSMDRSMGVADKDGMTTTITGVGLRPNGEESAMFCVDGVKFGCSGDVKYIGITAGDEGWLTFSGYGGHTWRIKKP